MPRQLDLAPDIKEKLQVYLTQELVNHRSERGELDRRWINEEDDTWAESRELHEDSPFSGFASIIIPLTAIAIEAITARFTGQLFGLKEFVRVSVTDEFAGLRNSIEKYYNNLFLNKIGIKQALQGPNLQLIKHGTGIAQSAWVERKAGKVIIDSSSPEPKEVRVPVFKKKGVEVRGIPIEDFIMPFYALDPCQSPWVGHRTLFTKHDIKSMVASGILAPTAYEDLQNYYNSLETADSVLENKQRETNTVPTFPKTVYLSRILLLFDVDGNGEETYIEVYFHEDSYIVVSVCYYDGDEPDYDKGVYMPMEFRWYGYGVAKQNWAFQEEVTAVHRQRLDNASIANMAMFKIKRSSKALADGEPLFPGKKLFVDSMDEIEPLFMGDVKASAYNDENQIVIYSQQRTGVNELTLGMPNVGTPGTASDSLARVQESNRKFDYVYSNGKDFNNAVVYRATQLDIKHFSAQREILDWLPQGAEVQKFLQQKEALTNRLFFNIEIAGAKNNKILDRNTYSQLVTMQTQYWTQILTLAQQMNDPILVQEMSKQALRAADQINISILEAYDIPNPEKLIFNFDAYKPAAPQQNIPAGILPDANPAMGGSSSPALGGITSVLAPGARIDAGQGAANINVGGNGLSLAG